MVYILGQKVVINHSAFYKTTGTIIEVPNDRGAIYYRVEYDQKVLGYYDGLFKEEELELVGSENILSYVKLRLIASTL